jgi:uncharacterized protein YdhG (YjbR/CyaY superfamily)
LSVIDDYLKNIEPAKRRALERIRSLAKAAVPDAQEAISYGMPTLKRAGKSFLGFDVHKNHIGIYPYSGHVIEKLKADLQGYETSKGAIRIPFDKPIPEATLRKLIECRLAYSKE